MAKQKIAILGGGVGAMTSAFYLSSQPGWADRFDITVYQLGWRLGGKGASGRNRDIYDRIEEHGFHIFFGYYENAFAMMRQVYAELGRNPNQPLAGWQDAWKPWSYFVLYEELAGEMVPWVFDFPTNEQQPGDGKQGLPSPWQMFTTALKWCVTLLGMTPEAPPSDQTDSAELGRGLDHPMKIPPRAALHAALLLIERMSSDADEHSDVETELIKLLLEAFRAWLREQIKSHAGQIKLELRRIFLLIEVGVTTLIGMIVDKLIKPPVDWFKIDGKTFPDWLMSHGASSEAANCSPVELCTTMNFAQYLGGFGAGSCLYFALRICCTYKGAFSWRMQAGMGDTIFAPFYEVLRKRGVKFEFFHSVSELGIGTDDKGNPIVETVTIDVQMKPKVTQGDYNPLYDVKGLPCWPSAPLYEQLDRGEELAATGENLEDWWTRWKNVETKTLKLGTDFDLVVLGISIGAYPYICKQLIDNPKTPQFAKMVDALVVTETIGAQLWLAPNTAGLGWTLGGADNPIVGTYWEPCDTVADMSYLIDRENWPPASVGCIQYMTAGLMCDVPPPTPPRSDWQYPRQQYREVRRQVVEWLSNSVRTLWPAATLTNEPRELNWWWLVDRGERVGSDRFDGQWWVGEWNPSDRYVLSVPGSVWSRLPSAGTGYANLLMAGDWTLSGLSQGCVESAVMSGMHVSRALTGYPAVIVGDNEPDGGDVPPPPPVPPVRPRGQYVEYDGNPTPLQPYIATDVTMYNFIIEADYAKLTAILDNQLNLGGPTIYKPLGPFLVFVAAPITQIAATEPQAWMPEKDFGFWIPVLAGRQVGNQFLVDRPAFFIPYLWVDSYLPQQSGREVFGYEKGVGILKNPSSPDDAAEFTLDAFVAPQFGAPGQPQTQWQWQRLVTAAKHGGGKIGNLVREFETLGQLGEAVIAQIVKAFQNHSFDLPTLQLLKALWDDATHLDIPMVYLKQFRDIADGTRACYQAIVESPNQIDPKGGFQAGFIDGFWELAINQYASVSLIDNLGLVVKDGKVPVAFPFWAKFSFTCQNGRVVWRGV